MSGKAIIWDFDGTLVLHKGLWSGTMMAALDTLIRDHNISIECLKPYLHTGFPWHEAEKAHPELSYPGAWWNRLEGYLKTIFEKVGFEENTSSALAKKTHNAGIIPILLHTTPPDETFNYCRTIDEIESKINGMMM